MTQKQKPLPGARGQESDLLTGGDTLEDLTTDDVCDPLQAKCTEATTTMITLPCVQPTFHKSQLKIVGTG